MPRHRDPHAYGDPAAITAARVRSSSETEHQTNATPTIGADAVSALPRLTSDSLLTLAEFAALVRRHPRTVRGWLRDGLVPAVRIGRAKFIPASAVHKWLFGNHQISENGIESNSTQVKAYTTTSDTLSMAPIPEFPAFSPFNQR